MEQKFKGRVIVLFFIGLVLFGVNFLFADKIKDFFYGQTYEPQSFTWKLANAIMFANADKTSESKKLIEENQKLLAQLADLQSLQEENQFLRNALNLESLKGKDFWEAEVFGGAKFNGIGFSYSDSLFITKGKKDGIQKGFAVITADKVLLGKISEVYDNHSKVSLLTDKNSVVDVQIINEIKKEEAVSENATDQEDTNQDKENVVLDKSVAIAKGEGSLKITLDMFPKDKDLKDGDLVITSALSGAYPSGYVVGRIKDPKEVDSEAFKQAEIVPAFDIKILDKVLILKDIEIVKND